MKKQYIAAIACLMAGAIGFIGVYANNAGAKKQQDVAKNVESAVESPKTAETSNVIKPKPQIVEPKVVEEEKEEKEEETQAKEEEQPVEDAVAEISLHFAEDSAVSPMKGEVILPYSMDKTVYFPTLDQYKYNPAVIVQGEVDDKVCFIAKGNITNIEKNEETGCTVTQDLGDGYTAIYGQLKDLTVKVGDSVESGEIAGYIAEPTKYYSVEGSNLYFQMLKDGKSVDPTEYINK